MHLFVYMCMTELVRVCGAVSVLLSYAAPLCSDEWSSVVQPLAEKSTRLTLILLFKLCSKRCVSVSVHGEAVQSLDRDSAAESETQLFVLYFWQNRGVEMEPCCKFDGRVFCVYLCMLLNM